MINPNLSLLENLAEAEKRIDSLEEALGKGLLEPFNSTNSGARKILFGTQFEHAIPLIHAEVPLVQTGYEIRFGDYSASIIKADSDYFVESIISKFSSVPRQHYFVIIRSDENKEIKVVERIPYEHTTETYGYLYNNSYMDSLSVGSKINQGDVIRKSTSYDEYGNRKDGVNLLCAYLATDKTMEDSVILSESGAAKLSTPLIKKVTLMFNENDIPLNLYGNEAVYKSFPNIGEPIKCGILCAIRREKKEESLYTQSYNKLMGILMSDDKFTLDGIVVDLNIYSNNPQILNNFYNAQLKYYYDENIRFCTELVNAVDRLRSAYPDYKLSYDLQKLYHNSKRILKGDQYIKEDKVFSNTVLEVFVVEEKPIMVGDKVSDRYGGKGVISEIIPDHLMMKDDLGETVECIINQSTCVNRENPGQLFETSITHIGARIVHFIKTGVLSPEESSDIIIEFLKCISPQEAEYLKDYLSKLPSDYLESFINSILVAGMIYISVRPISETMTIDKLAEIYNKFPWIKQSYMQTPILDSNGEVRYVKSRRPIICGKKYIYRLKQYAEEKFSVTSLSSTNIKNQNTKNKANKNYKSLHANTPIQFGDMETADMQHIGMEYVVTNLMIHSVSPQARRLVEQMLTGDPFDVNIELDKDSTNRSVEIVNAYLKTKGLRLVFKKIPKKKQPMVTFDMVVIDKDKVPQYLVEFINENEVFDFDKYYKKLYKVEELRKKAMIQQEMVYFD